MANMILGCYALAGFGFVCCLILFVTIKRDLFRLERRMDRKNSSLEVRWTGRLGARANGVQELEAKLDGLDARLKQVENPIRERDHPPVRLTPRQKVVQMADQGRASEAIAASVRLPRHEVDLLLKVHRAVARAG